MGTNTAFTLKCRYRNLLQPSMHRRSSWLSLAAALLLAVTAAFARAAETPRAMPPLTIGVLAYRGSDLARETWRPTLRHLRQALPEAMIRLQPLSLSEMDSAAANGAVDFILTNPGHAYQLIRRFGASPVATARTMATEDPARALGSAIITRADSGIEDIADVAGKRLLVVDRDAFGGFLVAWHAMGRALGHPPQALVVEHGFPHQGIVEAVLRGEAEAGVVRACLLESLAARGRLDPEAVRVLNPRDAPRFHCRVSTPLYPGWAFLQLPHVAPETATAVAQALLAMPTPERIDPWLGHDGWIAPLSYAAVEGVYRDLGLYPFERNLGAALARWMGENAAWVAAAIILIGAFLLHVAHVEVLVRRRTRQLEKQAVRIRALEGELAHTERVSSMAMLAGSLAHDLNQPLTAIATYAHGLRLRLDKGTADASAIRGAIDRMGEEAARASAFIRSMRDFLAKGDERREGLDLRDVVDEVVMLMTTFAAKRSVRLDWARPHGPAMVHGDGVQLRQAVVALVQNAIEAQEDAGGDVEIRLTRDGQGCRLSVGDRGSGLAEEARHRATEPFFSTKGGLGLGLATAAQIVDRHGGQLRLEPRSGGGTLALVSLPPPDTPEPAA